MQIAWHRVWEGLPPVNVLVGLINVTRRQNDPSGDYPIAHIVHLSEFGGRYWSCLGERAMTLDSFTHWCELPPWPPEFVPLEGDYE